MSLFAMGRPPRGSTLFPYTTLFRSKSISMKRFATRARGRSSRIVKPFSRIRVVGRERSEEHTSELQSLRHLVCRLLLEKKKGPGPGRRLPEACAAPTATGLRVDVAR